jgi:tetratricopeptide (TPR) repeat protein
VRLGLAALYRQQRKLDEAVGEYDKVIQASATDPAGLRARNAKAELLMARGRRADAVALVNEVLKVNPRDNDALLLRGQASLARGDATSAVSDLRTVLKDQPNAIPVLSALARAHLANREPKLAVEIAGGAVDRYPANAEVRMMAAEVRAGSGDLAGAIADLDAVLKANPRDTRALLAKANLLVARKDMTGAEKLLRDAQAANPQDALIPYRLGEILAAQNRTDAAVVQFETSLARLPGAIEPLNALVRLYLGKGQAAKALALAEKAAAERPKDILVQTLLGDVYSASKRDAEAEAAFRRAIALNPKVVGPYEELSNHHLRRRDVAKATAVVLEGLEASPGNPVLMHRRAMLHVSAGEIDEAIRLYDEILAKRPDDTLAANNLATLLLDNRSDAKSHERALELARRLDASPNPAHLDTLGWAHYRLGKYDEAIGWLRKANQKAPSVAIFNYHLGMALHKSGDAAGAKPFLEAAVKAGANFPGLDEARRILGQS